HRLLLLGDVNRAVAALAEQLEDLVAPDFVACPLSGGRHSGGLARGNGGGFTERPAFLVGLKQRQDLSEKGRIVAAGGRDVGAALGRGHLKRAGENGFLARIGGVPRGGLTS